MKNLRTLSLSLATVATGLVSFAGETVLWPSSLTEMKAQQDSSLAFAPGGVAQVKTGTKASWPGMRMDF